MLATGGLIVGLGIWALERSSRPGGDELAIPSVGREATLPETVEQPRELGLEPQGGQVSARRLLDADRAAPQVVRGTVRVAPGRGPAMHLRLLWSGTSARAEFEEIPIDSHGSFEVEPPAGVTQMHAAVRLPNGYVPVKSVPLSAGLPDVSFAVGFGLVRTLHCVDSSSAGLAGVTVFDFGGKDMHLPVIGPLDPKIRARELGTTDSDGNLLLVDLSVGGTYLGFLVDGVRRTRRFVTPSEEGEPLVVELRQIPDLVGIAPSPAGHARVRIRANERAARSGYDAATRTWRPGSSSDPSAEIEVLAGDPFKLIWGSGSLPVLECRSLAGDEVLALGAVDPQTGQYTDWRSPDESVLYLDLGALPPGDASAHLVLVLQVGVTKVFRQIMVERGRSPQVRVPLGRVFLSQPARIEWAEGLRTRAFAQTVLEPGEQALRLLASEPACLVRIAVRSRGTAAPLVDAPVEIRTTDGESRSLRLRTDLQGDVALAGEPGRSYVARVRAEDVAGEVRFLTSEMPGASPLFVELWVEPTTASLRVEVRSTQGADVRVGLARARDWNAVHVQTRVSIAKELGPTQRTSWEVAARRALGGGEVIFEGLSPGAYMVYARSLEPREKFMSLSAPECVAEPLHAKVVLEAGEKGLVRLAPSLRPDAHAWIQLELGSGPSNLDLNYVVVEVKPAPDSGGGVLRGSRGVTRGRHTGGGLFEVPIVRNGAHQVRVVGVGPVPVTRAMTLISGQTTALRMDRTWVLITGGEWDLAASYELRLTGLGVESAGGASDWYGIAEASIDPPQPGIPLTLTHLDPTVQYRAELQAGKERVVRMLLPVNRSKDPTAIKKDTLWVHGK